MALPQVLDRLISLVFPQRCLACEDVVQYDDFLCENCHLTEIGRLDLPFAHNLADLAACAEYSDTGRDLVLKAKEGGTPRLYSLLAAQMQAVITQCWGGVCFDAIAPVPTTGEKRIARGFNQTEWLATPLSKLTQIPVYPHLLRRKASSKTQHELDSDRRRENARASYEINQPELAAGKTILLLDDLITTGHTISACADCLLGAGAAKVYALSAAYRPRWDKSSKDLKID